MMVDLSLVDRIQCKDEAGNIIIVTQDVKQREFDNSLVKSAMLVRMPLRITGGKISNAIVPIINFLLSPLFLLLRKPKLAYFEHHGLILEMESQSTHATEYWTAQKYQDGVRGPIRIFKAETVAHGVDLVKDCGNNLTATHTITKFAMNKEYRMGELWEFMRLYSQEYSLVRPQHCQTFTGAFIDRFCTR